MQDDVVARLERIEGLLRELAAERPREWYGVEEFAGRVGKTPYTVREWCRLGRLAASKRRSGRGRYHEWAIAHAELERYRREGLLPDRRVEDRAQGGAGLVG